MEDKLDITLDSFQLRWYQEEVWDAIDSGKYKNLMLIAARRSGKDLLGWNLLIYQAIKKVCLCFHVLPNYNQAKKVIWNAITNDGKKFLDFVPKELVKSINHSEMKIEFINGSILQCIGAKTYDSSIVGTNPYAVVFSEYSLISPNVYDYLSPILGANKGWCMFVGTPRGKNHMYHLFNAAQKWPDWKVVLQKTSQINHIDKEWLSREKERRDDGFFLQEYECSFDRGIEGSYYGKHLDNLRLNDQICHVPWDPGLLVHTAWDIGVHDATAIIFFQTLSNGMNVRIIDCYSNTNVGIDHYAKIIQDKPYRYGKHFAPHDIKVREFGAGAITRLENARRLGINFTLVDQVGFMDGIEETWKNFNKFWIDDNKCRSLIDALENYHREWNEEKKMYSEKPVKSWANHYADALRYLSLSIHKTADGLSSEEFDRKKHEALYGNRNILPRPFRTGDFNSYR